jgi:hypothetical protein
MILVYCLGPCWSAVLLLPYSVMAAGVYLQPLFNRIVRVM